MGLTVRLGDVEPESIGLHTGWTTEYVEPPVVLFHQPADHHGGFVGDSWELEDLGRPDGRYRMTGVICHGVLFIEVSLVFVSETEDRSSRWRHG